MSVNQVSTLWFCLLSPLAVSDTVKREDLSSEDQTRVDKVTKPASSFDKPEAFERMQAGAGTSLKINNRHAFSHPLANLSFEEQQRFLVGNGLFRKTWVSSPASTQASAPCSDQPGRGRETVSATLSEARTRPSPPVSAALTAEVPRSMPRWPIRSWRPAPASPSAGTCRG